MTRALCNSWGDCKLRDIIKPAPNDALCMIDTSRDRHVLINADQSVVKMYGMMCELSVV